MLERVYLFVVVFVCVCEREREDGLRHVGARESVCVCTM